MVSITIRKNIKYLLQKYFYPKLNKNIIETTLPGKIDTAIINLSVIPWNFRYQRPQQLANQLAKNDYPVFYIDNEFNITNNLIKVPFTLETISQNLYSVKLSSSNNYFIYQNLPNIIDIEIISNSIKNLINTAKIEHPILKIDHPFWISIASKLKLPVIYDCLDNQDSFELNSSEIKNEEIKLFQLANKIIVTSQFLYDKALKYRTKNDIALISNGTDYEHFSKNNIVEIINNISKYPKPIFGYFGAIEKWFDTDFIEKLAKDLKGSVVLIGQNNLGYKPQNKNIYLLGEKPYKSIPQYLSQFDVCLIPFKLNSLTKAVNPVKVFEYFSQGKPVITSRLPELEKFKDLLYFYSSDTDTSMLTIKVFNEPRNIYIKRRKIAQNNTWESKADKIITILKEL